MRKLTVAEFVTLDGVIQAPGGPDEDPGGGFRFGGWIADAVTTLKHQPGPNLLTHGSGDMVRQLLADGLVDELLLIVYPVVVGRGKRLFNDNARATAFTLVHSTTTTKGALITRYNRGGKVRTGSFESIG